jgi:dienelactone hydrolase
MSETLSAQTLLITGHEGVTKDTRSRPTLRTPYPSPEQVAELDEILTANHKPDEFHSYDDAGHAFFSVDRPSYRVAAANDGWERITDFYAIHLGG